MYTRPVTRLVLVAICLSLTGCSSVVGGTDDPDSAPALANPGTAPQARTSESSPAEQVSPSVEGFNKQIADDVESRLNAERVAKGLGELIRDDNLVLAASQWAETMSREGYKHSSLERLTEIRVSNGFGSVAENIHNPKNQCPSQPCLFEEYYPSSGTLHVDWMRSSEHRNAMLEPGFSRVGVGIYCSNSGELWAVTLFASSNENRIQELTQTAYTEPVLGGSDGYTCAGRYRDIQPMWVNSPIK